MRGPGSTAPPLPPSGSARFPAGRLRRLAVVLAAGLLASLFAPSSTQTVAARGLAGPRRIRVSFSGWQALSPATLACVAVALAVVALLFVRSRTVIEGLGAHRRRAARARIDGGLVATGGLVAAGALLAGLLHHPGPAVNVPGAVGSAGVRWGAGLGLLLALGLVGLGLAIERAAALAGRRGNPTTHPEPEAHRDAHRGPDAHRDAHRGPDALRERDAHRDAHREPDAHRSILSRWGASLRRHGSASLYPRGRPGPAGGGGPTSARSQSVPDGEPPMPEFDFTVGDGRRRTGERAGPLSPRQR